MSEAVIVASGGANLASLEFALERLGARAHVTSDAAVIAAAPRVILPGVGSAGSAMQRLRAAGLAECLPALEQPVLGICLGMQLLYALSAEGDTACLGVLPGAVERLAAAPGLAIPHMGWNQLEPRGRDPLLEGIALGDHAYFVHSFAAPVGAETLATARHGIEFSAVVRHRNFWGTQFHPERSGHTGAVILANFLEVVS
ncbi:MAG: imidazole glycerol phosphate synthase subunit HisH [Steroidobacteraceae bacterium]